ncbi:outer membrane protein [Helicobacter cetorum]|uniref:outer membrane protein n=1 Tax=Helicobacter cetorum TaxID=138563 RepID=UPI00131551F4|nr:outer membrane protein [Helicobacter cetorum]
MELMKKFVALGLLSSVLSSSLLAEGDGVYVGAGYEIGQARVKTNVFNWTDGGCGWQGCPPGLTTTRHNIQGTPINWHSQFATGALNGFGLTLGYKKFFQFKSLGMTSRWLGFRVYSMFDYGHATLGHQNNYTGKLQLDMVSWGFGLDALFNIIDKDNASFGVFSGFSLGGNTWKSSATMAWRRQIEALKGYSNAPSTVDWQVWLNFGVRTNLYKHNGVEFGVRLPMLINNYLSAGPLSSQYYYHLKRDFSLYVRYLYTF